MFWNADTDTGVRHEALFYADTSELLAGAVPFVEAGLAAGEAVLVVVPPASRERIEAALVGRPDRLRFAATDELGRNPARMIAAWRELVDAGIRGGFGVRGVSELSWAGRGAAELEECERYEALLNLAFAGAPSWSLMCPYNTRELADRVLDGAACNHPYLREGVAAGSSGHYRPRLAPDQVFAGALGPPAEPAAEIAFGAADLPRVRRLVAELGTAAGLRSGRIEDLVLAANEVATNSVRHGGGSGLLRAWRDGAALVCEVRDHGRFRDPLVGRLRPGSQQLGGRGLWIANQVCDLVQIRSAEFGSVVRLRVAS